MIVSNFIESVIQEKSGFSLDEAWRLNEQSLSAVVPVLRETKKKRDYVTLAEAKKVKIEDTGDINYVYVKNLGKKPLLVSRGEFFRSESQERAATHGHVIQPGKGMRVSVRCIHQSNPISKGQKMEYGGRVPYAIDLGNQHKTWESVNVYTTNLASSGHIRTTDRSKGMRIGRNIIGRSYVEDSSAEAELDSLVETSNFNDTDLDGGILLGSSSNNGFNEPVMEATPAAAAFAEGADESADIVDSDDLVGTLDKMSDTFKEIMKKIPYIKNQTGAIFLNENDVQGLDIYDLKESWKSVKEDVVSKEGSNFIKKEKDNPFELNPKKIKSWLSNRLGVDFQEKTIHDSKDYKIIEVREVNEDSKSKSLRGEAVLLNGEVIHLTLYRN